MRPYLFSPRAKSPQPQADREETGEEDEDGVRLNPRKSVDNALMQEEDTPMIELIYLSIKS